MRAGTIGVGQVVHPGADLAERGEVEFLREVRRFHRDHATPSTLALQVAGDDVMKSCRMLVSVPNSCVQVPVRP